MSNQSHVHVHVSHEMCWAYVLPFKLQQYSGTHGTACMGIPHLVMWIPYVLEPPLIAHAMHHDCFRSGIYSCTFLVQSSRLDMTHRHFNQILWQCFRRVHNILACKSHLSQVVRFAAVATVLHCGCTSVLAIDLTLQAIHVPCGFQPLCAVLRSIMCCA